MGRPRQAAYQQTPQGKAAMARYLRSPKGRATTARYRASAKGRAMETAANAKKNALRLHIGRRYMGLAATVEQARTINTHIRSRLHEFVAGQQSRAEAEGLQASPVSPEAESRTD